MVLVPSDKEEKRMLWKRVDKLEKQKQKLIEALEEVADSKCDRGCSSVAQQALDDIDDT